MVASRLVADWVLRLRAADDLGVLSGVSVPRATPDRTRPSLGKTLWHPGEQPDIHFWPTPRVSLRVGTDESVPSLDLCWDILDRHILRCLVLPVRQSLDHRDPAWLGGLVY